MRAPLGPVTREETDGRGRHVTPKTGYQEKNVRDLSAPCVPETIPGTTMSSPATSGPGPSSQRPLLLASVRRATFRFHVRHATPKSRAFVSGPCRKGLPFRRKRVGVVRKDFTFRRVRTGVLRPHLLTSCPKVGDVYLGLRDLCVSLVLPFPPLCSLSVCGSPSSLSSPGR